MTEIGFWVNGRPSREETVKHFSEGEWIDFARQVLNEEQTASMQRHLDGGCDTCAKTVEIWRSFADFARQEASYEPPATAVRIAESYFAPMALAAKGTDGFQLAESLFDSFERHVFEGVRGAAVAPRQLMYKSGSLLIDMRLVPKVGSKTVALTGQIVDSEEPAGGLAGVSVCLLSSGNTPSTFSRVVSNQFGEFYFSFQAEEDLKLLFSLKDGAFVVRLPQSELNEGGAESGTGGRIQ